MNILTISWHKWHVYLCTSLTSFVWSRTSLLGSRCSAMKFWLPLTATPLQTQREQRISRIYTVVMGRKREEHFNYWDANVTIIQKNVAQSLNEIAVKRPYSSSIHLLGWYDCVACRASLIMSLWVHLTQVLQGSRFCKPNTLGQYIMAKHPLLNWKGMWTIGLDTCKGSHI